MDIDQIIDDIKQFSTSLNCLSLDLVHVFVGTDQFSFKTSTMSTIKMISTGVQFYLMKILKHLQILTFYNTLTSRLYRKS